MGQGEYVAFTLNLRPDQASILSKVKDPSHLVRSALDEMVLKQGELRKLVKELNQVESDIEKLELELQATRRLAFELQQEDLNTIREMQRINEVQEGLRAGRYFMARGGDKTILAVRRSMGEVDIIDAPPSLSGDITPESVSRDLEAKYSSISSRNTKVRDAITWLNNTLISSTKKLESSRKRKEEILAKLLTI